MCTYVSKTSTRDLLKRIRENKTKHIKAWKIVSSGSAFSGNYDTNSLYSYFNAKFEKPWKRGTNVSDVSCPSSPMMGNQQVNRGFHVYLTKPRLDRMDIYNYRNNGVLEVVCNLDDLIAAGSLFDMPQAVFTKVSVGRVSLKKAKIEAYCSKEI